MVLEQIMTSPDLVFFEMDNNSIEMMNGLASIVLCHVIYFVPRDVKLFDSIALYMQWPFPLS